MNYLNKKDNYQLHSYTPFIMLIIISGYINFAQFGAGISQQIIFVLGFLGILFINYKIIDIHISMEGVLLILYWFILMFSTFFSSIVIVRRDIFTYLFSTILFILITGIDYKKKDIKYIIYIYIAVCLISAILIVVNFINGNRYMGFSNRYSVNFFGVEKDPNYTAAYIVPGILLVLFTLFKPKSKNKFLKLLTVAFMSIGVIITNSRAGFLTLILAFLITISIFIYNSDFSVNSKIGLLILIIVIGVILLGNINTILSLPVFERIGDVSNYTDTSRLTYWSNAIGLLRDYPLFGGGYGSAHAYTQRVFDFASTHSSFVDLLLNTGLIGLCIMGIFFINLFLGKKGDRIYLFSLLIIFLIPMAFNSMINTASFWVPMYIMGILKQYSLKSNEKIYEWF